MKAIQNREFDGADGVNRGRENPALFRHCPQVPAVSREQHGISPLPKDAAARLARERRGELPRGFSGAIS